MKNNHIQHQSESNTQYEWNLNDIYPSQKDFDEELAQHREALKKIEPSAKNITKSAQDLYECLSLLDDMKVRFERLATYAFLKFSLDQSSIPNQELRDQMNVFEVEFNEKTSFLIPTLLTLDKTTLEKFQKEETRLDLYKIYFELLEKAKPHVLDEKGEKLLASSYAVNKSLENAYTNLKVNDIKLPKIKDEEGKEIELTHASYQAIYRSSPDRRVREDAHKAYFGALNANKYTFSSIYDGLINFRIFQAKARNYKDALEAATTRDFQYIDSAIARNLVATANKNLEPLHRYMRIKAKELGLPKLQVWDLYAPMGKKKSMEVPYEEAKSCVGKSLEVMGNEYMQVIRTAMSQRWIDVYPRKAKYVGGFNTGVYSVHPFILLNYQNTLRDVEVVAHELGHAAHSYFSSKNQPYIYSNYTIFVAEIASITNEIILYKYLLAHEKDTLRRREMLYQFLNGINATFYRQAMFAEFEDNAHALAEEGKSINAESLAKIWMDIQKKYYGDTIELDELSSIYWAYIPHFFASDFYVYQYATSMCAAIVIGERIYNGDKELLTKYLNFLKQGSRKNSVELVKDLGIDLSKPEPIMQAIHAFEKLLNEYEETMGLEKSS